MPNEETFTETSSASAGDAKKIDTSTVLSRAETRGSLSEAELNARQAAVRETRRQGGVPVGEETETTPSVPSDVPPTDCQELAQ
jgi:hypothetical protein